MAERLQVLVFHVFDIAVDVVDVGRWRQPPGFAALATQRLCGQNLQSNGSPA